MSTPPRPRLDPARLTPIPSWLRAWLNAWLRDYDATLPDAVTAELWMLLDATKEPSPLRDTPRTGLAGLWCKIRIEVWWWAEKRAGRLWNKLLPDGQASYWLDFLPAWTGGRRYDAENDYGNRGHSHTWVARQRRRRQMASYRYIQGVRLAMKMTVTQANDLMRIIQKYQAGEIQAEGALEEAMLALDLDPIPQNLPVVEAVLQEERVALGELIARAGGIFRQRVRS